MKKFFASILLATFCILTGYAGVAPVQMNPYTTNLVTAADAYARTAVASITNGLATTNYVNGAVLAGGATTNFVLTSISATNTANLIITTNLIVAATNGLVLTGASTNFVLTSISATNTANLVITTNLIVAATNQLASTNYVNAAVLSGGATTNFVLTSISATNAANLATTTNLVVAATNNFTTLVYTNPSAILYTSSLPALTNGFVTSAITNGLATTNYVTNYVNAATNGLVTSSITNGLATTNYVNAATNGLVTSAITNGLATTDFVIAATNGLVTSSITNGLATTNYVNAATNGLVTSSITNGLATTNYVNAVTNGLVTSSITNGLATTNYVNAATNGLVTSSITNGLATTNYVNSITNNFTSLVYTNPSAIVYTSSLPALTNGFVTASITNGLATTNYVNAATNDLVTAAITNGLATTNYANSVTNNFTSIVYSNPAAFRLAGDTNFPGIYVTNSTFIGYNLAQGHLVTASGNFSSAQGDHTTASATASHAEGGFTVASGAYSHAEGNTTTASGNYAHAEGASSTASGDYAHAEGSSQATINYAHAEGSATTASDDSTHSEGTGTTASYYAAHAEGEGTVASGEAAHAEGSGSTASGGYSHVEGDNSTASGTASHAAGSQANAAHDYTWVWSDSTGAFSSTTNNQFSVHAANGTRLLGGPIYGDGAGITNLANSPKIFYGTNTAIIASTPTNLGDGLAVFGASGAGVSVYPFAVQRGTADALGRFAGVNYRKMGILTTNSLFTPYNTGSQAFLEVDSSDYGRLYLKSGTGSYISLITSGGGSISDYILLNPTTGSHISGSLDLGYSSSAGGLYSFAQGDTTTASGYASQAEGYVTTASGLYTHAEGLYSVSSGTGAHAEGDSTIASGYTAHAEGYGSTAAGDYSHSEGTYDTTANGYASHAEGGSTTGAAADYAHAEGYLTTASGLYSHSEGRATTASGAYSHAAGQNATASSSNTWAWSDGTSFGSTINKQFSVYAANGIRLLGGPIFGDNIYITNNAVVLSKLGIATDAPAYALDLYSSSATLASLTTTSGNTSFIQVNNGIGDNVLFGINAGSPFVQTSSGNIFQIQIGGGDLSPLAASQIGVNTIIPEYTLDVNGTGHFTTNVYLGGNLYVTNHAYDATTNLLDPEANEYVTASFVRSVLNNGAFLYGTTNNIATGISNVVNGATNTVAIQFGANNPAAYVRGFTNFVNGTYPDGPYFATVISTNTYQAITGPFVNDLYIQADGSSQPALSITPDIFVTYDRTNLISICQGSGQALLMDTTTNLYTWIQSAAQYNSTNMAGFYVVRRVRVVSQNGNNLYINVQGGNTTPTTLAFNTPVTVNANYSGTFTGNGAGLTNVTAYGGTNGVYGGVGLTNGVLTGNGSGLTNVYYTNIIVSKIPIIWGGPLNFTYFDYASGNALVAPTIGVSSIGLLSHSMASFGNATGTKLVTAYALIATNLTNLNINFGWYYTSNNVAKRLDVNNVIITPPATNTMFYYYYTNTIGNPTNIQSYTFGPYNNGTTSFKLSVGSSYGFFIP